MVKPLFASLFAALLAMPGCGKTQSPPTPRPAPVAVDARVGRPAPNIVGVDLDNEPLSLAEFRGKVVALSFWANWCHHCRDLFPHEKELVEKFRDRPFVLVGVNADESRATAKSVELKHKLTWRSFHVGDPEGPVPTQWGVNAWPTIFILDAEGTIRYCFEGKQPANVERAIASLLRETK